MPKQRIALGAAVGLTLAVLPVASAAAAPANVVATIKAQDRIVRANPAYRQLVHFQVNTAAEAALAAPKFKALATLIDQAATKVAAASTTSSTQKTGQRSWVRGVREGAKGIEELSVALTKFANGDKTGAKTGVLVALKTVQRGNLETAVGDKLLGLPLKY